MEDRFSVDIELTNRCNAKCHFCPRDQTPHQGLMTPEVFAKSLERTLEVAAVYNDIPVTVSLCGLGEPLLNRHAASFVRQVRKAGLRCAMSSNASLLDEKRGRALLEAGLQEILINVGEHDDDYERVYKLPFEKTRRNIERFVTMAGDQCEVSVVLVDHRGDRVHLEHMETYWRDYGVKQFYSYQVMNRGGALFVDHMQFESYPELRQARDLFEKQSFTPVCPVPFAFLFIGYDGNYYLCCSDWKKDVPLGNVFTHSFTSLARKKLEHVTSREPICKTCNHDPTNMLVEELRGSAGTGAEQLGVDRFINESRAVTQRVHELIERAGPESPEVAPGRRRIPLSVRSS